MRTARSSSCQGGTRSPSTSPLGVGLDLIPSIYPLGVGLDLIPLNFPLGCGPGPDPFNFPLGCVPGSDPPQFPPWVWAWTWSLQFSPWVWAWIWSPSISTLGVGLDLIPLNFPLGCGPVEAPGPGTHLGADTPPGSSPPGAGIPPLLQGMLGYHLQCMLGYHPPAARHAGIPPAMHAGIPPPIPCGQNSWHMLLKILPCPKLRLRAVKYVALQMRFYCTLVTTKLLSLSLEILLHRN